MLRKILSFFGILIGTILLALIVIAAFFEDQVGELFVRELNKSLKNELRIENVDLSLIKHFPEAGVTLEGVKMKGGHSNSGTFLQAEDLSLRFAYMSLLSGKYKINSIDISDASMNVLIDKQGRASYDVFKDSGETSSSNAEFDLALKQANLNNIEVIYIDEITEQEVIMTIENADISGEFSNEKFLLNCKTNIFSNYIQLGEERYLTGKELDYSGKMDIDLKDGVYELRDMVLEVDNANTFIVDGTVTSIENHTDYDLTIKGEDCSLSSVLGVLPVEYSQQFGDFESTGTFYFNSYIKGRSDAYNAPLTNITFGLNDGKITSPRLDYALRDATFEAVFDNGGNNPERGYFDMPEFSAKLRGEPIIMHLKATNLDEPDIEFDFKGNVSMAAVHDLLNFPIIEDGDGLFEVTEFSLAGKYKDMIDPYTIGRVDTKAVMNFNDFELEMNGKTVTFEEGELSMHNNKLSVKEVNITAPGTDLIVTGDFKNLIPVFFKDSLNTKDAHLEFSALLNGESLDIDQLIEMASLDIDEGDVPEAVYDSLKQDEVAQNEDFFALLDGTFEANIDKINYRKINAENLTGQLIFADSKLKIRNVKVEAMEGNFTLKGDVTFDEKPDLTTMIFCENINGREFFEQAENFGQDYLTNKHVRGTLDAKMKIDAQWDETGEFLYDKLVVLADVELTDGELVGFEMLEDFSKYIKIQDLRRIKFKNTKNQFALKDNAFYIPTMFIQSNALNLTFSGRHTVEHEMDYLIKVNGGQTLMNKFKKFNPERKPLKAKKKGFINIYTHVFGTMDEYDFKYGKKNYKRILEAELGRKYEQIRQEVSRELAVDALYEPTELQDEN